MFPFRYSFLGAVAPLAGPPRIHKQMLSIEGPSFCSGLKGGNSVLLMLLELVPDKIRFVLNMHPFLLEEAILLFKSENAGNNKLDMNKK